RRRRAAGDVGDAGQRPGARRRGPPQRARRARPGRRRRRPARGRRAMIGDLLALALAVVLLALNAFFVGSEFALVSARRSAIEPRAEEGSRRARIALYGMEHVSLMMAGAQLGITVCTLGLGVLGEPAIAHLLE